MCGPMGFFSGRLSHGAIAHTGLILHRRIYNHFYVKMTKNIEYSNETHCTFMSPSLQKCEELRSPPGTNQRWLQVKEKNSGKCRTFDEMSKALR